jgi:hypothetical protein
VTGFACAEFDGIGFDGAGFDGAGFDGARRACPDFCADVVGSWIVSSASRKKERRGRGLVIDDSEVNDERVKAEG